MFRNVILGFSLPFVLNCLSSVSTGYWISGSGTAKQLNLTGDITEEKNGASFYQDLLENSTTYSNGSDNLFWTVSDTNETTEDDLTLQGANQHNQETIPEETNKEEIEDLQEKENEEADVQASALTETKPIEQTEMDEKIVLQRMNCHLEIAIQDNYDLKIQIKFAQLQNNTSGKCCITLNGPENRLLAIFISNIHLYQNGSDGEVLKVITPNHGSAYILKEYHHQSTYQPLLLTETRTVYLVLHYRVTTVFPKEKESYFNLEVLTYHRNENYSQTRIPGYSPAFSPAEQKLDKFYT